VRPAVEHCAVVWHSVNCFVVAYLRALGHPRQLLLVHADNYVPRLDLRGSEQALANRSSWHCPGGAYGARHSTCREMLFLCPLDGSESVETAGCEASIRDFISASFIGRSFIKIG
jgi:hypothetical protein